MPHTRVLRYEIGAALLLTAERLAMWVAVVSLAFSSYAWWGNPRTILAGGWRLSAVCVCIILALGMTHRIMLRRLHAAGRQRKRTGDPGERAAAGR